MEKLLLLKHWQLFILLFAIPFIIHMGCMAYIFTTVFTRAATKPDDPQVFFEALSPLMWIIPVMLVVFMTLNFIWQYSLGTNLYKKAPESVNLDISLFKVFLILPLVYIAVVCFFVVNMLLSIQAGGIPNPGLFVLIIPFHFFSIFCVLYCLYFNAKALKASELQRNVVFNDFIGEFFLMWFFFIGVWILQPRINKLFTEKTASNSDYMV